MADIHFSKGWKAHWI